MPTVRDIKTVAIGRRSRLRVLSMRLFMKPLLALMGRFSEHRMASLQIRISSGLAASYSGLSQRYCVFNGVPGSALGDLGDSRKRVILYLHGGAFLFPASPKLQVAFCAKLCADLDAVAFVPDYRLVPLHPAPAALDDCEKAYRGLLEKGFDPQQIVLAGESAGGTLVLALLNRLRRKDLPLPACAVPISPATELGRAHSPPSRGRNARRDALLPNSMAVRVVRWYIEGNDTSDPEISPLYADYTGFPPLYFIASENEILLDDSVLSVEQARQAGVEVKFDIWPVLPHAFPIFEHLFAEAPQARRDIVEFIGRSSPPTLAE